MDIFEREAIGIRGRFGVDVWEKWLSFQHSQEDFLRNYGVREDRIDGTVLALKRLLRDEGIMADKNYHRANRKGSINETLLRELMDEIVERERETGGWGAGDFNSDIEEVLFRRMTSPHSTKRLQEDLGVPIDEGWRYDADGMTDLRFISVREFLHDQRWEDIFDVEYGSQRNASHRANRKRANNPIFIRLLASRGVYGVGISGDIMAYVDLPIDENGTNFYWVVIDSNGDEIVGGASSSFEEATSLAENNLFRLSRELYPETYTSRRANRKRAYYDDYLESGGAFNYENPNYEYYTDREIEEGLRPQEFDGWSNRETQLAIEATSDFDVYLEVDNLAWSGTPDDIAQYYQNNIDHSDYDLNLVNWEEVWEAMRDQ